MPDKGRIYPKKKCPYCGKMIATNRFKAHVKAKHPSKSDTGERGAVRMLYSLEDWAKTGFSLADLMALQDFRGGPSDELKEYLEEATGKSYEEISLGNINDVFPGIYSDMLIEGFKNAMEWYKDIRKQVFG